MKSKCKWFRKGICFGGKNLEVVIRKWICDIDYYDKEIGCNPNCHGYCRAKEKDNDKR